MAGTLQEFYGNDIVYRFDKRRRITFGVITESYEASSDVDDFDNLEKGQIRVWWFMSSREQVWKQNKVRLLNRSILPGDIVRRFIAGQDTQRGYCKSSKQLVTLQIVGTDKIIEKVCSTRLKSVAKYSFDKTVCLDNKYGRIQNVDCKVTMQAKCGSSVEITRCSSTHATLDDYWLSKRNRWYSGAYYPGQEVVCIPQYLHGANWIHRSKTMKRRMQSRMRFTIQNVEVESVDVVWYQSDTDVNEVDKCSIKGDDIKRLKILESGILLDLAERVLLKLSSADKLLKKQDWLRKMTTLLKPDIHKVTSRHSMSRANRYRRSSSIQQPIPVVAAPLSDGEEWWTDDAAISDSESLSSNTSMNKRSKKKRHWPPRPREIIPGNTLAVEVLCYETKVTVVWQDGTIEEDIPSTQLYYSMSLDDHEFFPGEWVVAEGNQNGEEYGSVQSVDHVERTAKIKWFRNYKKDETTTAIEPTLLHTSELSVYDLQKHQKYQYRPGSIVYPVQITESRMGTVLDSYPGGYVHVLWSDGVKSNSWPQDLILLPEAEYDIMTESSTDFPAGSWETESIESIDGDLMHDENHLALMASKLDFIRSKMGYLKEAFRQHKTPNDIGYMGDLLVMYDNSSYLDKLLGTSFFSKKSHHFKVLLERVRQSAKLSGIELSGRLFSTDQTQHQSIKRKTAENENMEKVRNMESTFNAQIGFTQSIDDIPKFLESTSTPTSETEPIFASDNLCVELLSMIKARMDLAYSELVSRIGGQDAFMVMTKASENTPVPTVPSTPDDSLAMDLNFIKEIHDTITPVHCDEGYSVLDEAPKSHRFYGSKVTPTISHNFFKAIRREVKLLEESLPAGVWVRGFADRIDLLSVMIRGPSKTPYEDGLFLFDIQLGADYPHSPPNVHFISFSSERMNPNLYVEGKVCVSLLGTWIGKGSEVWGPSSSLLQLIVSIQGLILVSEPYYNEAGYEKQVESQQGYENSRTYNELVVLKLVQAMNTLLNAPPEVFKYEIISHTVTNGRKFCERIETWTSKTAPSCPDFPLLPVSKGFLISLQFTLKSFKECINKIIEEFNKTSVEAKV